MSQILLWILLASAPAVERLEAASRWLEVPEALEVVGASRLVRIDGVKTLGRHPATLAYFTAPGLPEEIAFAFLERWSRWGLPGTRLRAGDGVVASAFLSREQIQLALVARRHASQTVCFLTAVAWGDAEGASAPKASSPGASVELPPTRTPLLHPVRGNLGEVLAALDRAAEREGLKANRTQVLQGATLIEHLGPTRRVVTVVVPRGAEHWLWQWEEGP